MDKKHLAIALSKLVPAEPSHISLEQYQTDGDLAAALLWHAHLNKDIQNKTIGELSEMMHRISDFCHYNCFAKNKV